MNDEPRYPLVVPKRRHSVWDDVPLVPAPYVVPTCPACHGVAYKPIRGVRDEDGGRTSRRECADPKCRTRYIVVSEPVPELGNYE